MRIKKLDGLRGLFCILILVYHYQQVTFCFGKIVPNFITRNFIVAESYAFVDFFFVLSGFVITYNYNTVIHYTKDFYEFVKKRFARLFPLLFFSVIVYMFFELLFKKYFGHFYVLNYGDFEIIVRMFDTFLFTNATPLLGTSQGLNIPSWSISAEMISYLIFGMISLYPINKFKNKTAIVIIIMAILFSIYKKEYFSYGEFGFVRGIISFFTGYFVYQIQLKIKSIPNRIEYVIPIGIVLVLFLINSLSGNFKQMVSLFLIPFSFGLFIIILTKTNGFVTHLLNSKPLQYLGKISYSVYLNHYVLIMLMPVLFFKIIGLEQTLFAEIAVFLIVSILTIVYSGFTYKYVEIIGGNILKKKRNVRARNIFKIS